MPSIVAAERRELNISDALSGFAKLKDIRWMLRSATARKVLVDQLRALLPAGAAVGPCRLREVRFKPGRKATAYYDALVTAESPEGHHIRPVAVTWGPDAHPHRHEGAVALAKLQAEAVRRGVAAPFRQLMADFPDWTMQVWVSPLDGRFTQLVRLSDPQHVRALLADTGVTAAHARPRGEYTVTAIKYRPSKSHVLRYDPSDPQAGTVFAKLYIAEERAGAFRREDGARAFRVASKVADWLAEHGEGANCLRPLAYVAEDAVVLYPRVVGAPLSDCAQRSRSGVARWLQRAGAALCTLHQLPAALVGPLGPPHDFAAETRLIAKKSDHIPTLLPRVGSEIEALLDGARELHERLPQEPPSFAHGDLKSEHIWVAPGRLTVMDFDTSHLADPALDVGCFLADWQFSYAAGDQAELREMCESFLAGYARGAPKERLLRARLYEAIELVKCAVRRVQLFERGWASRTAGLVGRAQAVINDLQLTLGLPLRSAIPQESRQLQ